ncbi:MAG: LLM class flavin-dependent oxidoreductase [Candidatus Lambdaproteobacteria bacterium]|nr:LLM class flavin-dependent oxidoreductase [Candidatus Lambdaproteobacteria bacterium]
MLEIWASGASAPRGIRRVARDVEEKGWDGLSVVDSQNLSGDPFVALAMAATVTERLKLATGVTNSITRSAAVLATAIASVHSVSGGRAVLGIGRGDSALAHLGRAPARLEQFERYLRHLQAYLGGAGVPFEEIVDIPTDLAPPMAELHLADAPPDSRIAWIAESQAGDRKVPVEVAASGPRVIAIAARTADRVMFTLGADPARIRWGIALVRKARAEAGLDPDAIRYGAFIACACHPKIEVARQLVQGNLTVHARFGVMHGKTSGPLSDHQRDVMLNLRNAYDMRKHTRRDSAQAAVLTLEFIDQYAVVGTPERVIERLRALERLGLSKFILGGSRSTSEGGEAAQAKHLLETEVLPVLRG